MEDTQVGTRFAICIRNADAEDLQLRKVYQLLPSTLPLEDGFVRVIDESGEDYLYPADYFIVLNLPQAVERVLLQAA